MNKICQKCDCVKQSNDYPERWSCTMIGDDFLFNSKWKLSWCDPIFSIGAHPNTKLLKRMKVNCINYSKFKLIAKLKKL